MTDGLKVFRYHGSRVNFRKKLWNRIEKSGNVQNTARTIAEALMDFVTPNRYPKEIDKLIQKEILSLAANIYIYTYLFIPSSPLYCSLLYLCNDCQAMIG